MTAAEPVSPCIGLCVLDPASGYCRGCFRTIAEITAWPSLDSAGKRCIVDLIGMRQRQIAGAAAPRAS